MKFRQSLFWDIDVSKLDPDNNGEYVIERILDHGEYNELQWMISHYPLALINEVLENPRRCSPFTKALWAWLYPDQIDKFCEYKKNGDKIKFPRHAQKVYDKWYKTWWLNPHHTPPELR